MRRLPGATTAVSFLSASIVWAPVQPFFCCRPSARFRRGAKCNRCRSGSHSFSTLAVDWPGFGDQPKSFVDWRPEIYQAFLAHVFTQVVPNPFGTIAAGHAAGYILKHFATHDSATGRLVLLSATWRGLLLTLLGSDHALFAKLARAFNPPFLGAMLYGLNVNRVVIGMIARGAAELC